MGVKDNLVSWFIKNVSIPQMEVIDKPGFIVTHFSEKKQSVFLREILFPEKIFADLETMLNEKSGKAGLGALYAAGKEFGYKYSSVSYFPQLGQGNEKQIEEFVYMFMRYIESIWSEGVDYKIDTEAKTFDMKTKNFVVCNKNGLGYFVPLGIGAGFLSYILNEARLEGAQLECQGRGNETCDQFYAVPEVLEKKNAQFIKFPIQDPKSLEGVGPYYTDLNQIREAAFSNMSLKDMIDSGGVIYKNGPMYFGSERHFICEAHLFYLLENRLTEVPGLDEMLFDVSFNFGKSMSATRGQKGASVFVSNYLSSCGWGDVNISEKGGTYQVTSNYFPWTKMAEKVKFSMFRGMVSGMLSGCLGREIKLTNLNKNFSNGFFELQVSE